ncbi:response regulator [Undibacterium sp. RTI2.1]|uniref:response regulator n=1 Tax=unclassified Undibacterium TaxID=2630295 RepID=UPI002AB48A44|nr:MULTISPECIES: response regulator [unclassified Undibacterium]MDY7540172.1 response regulator [Undibacterium sp. 5I1]MEB0030346.1 response regulator [Undibacterium sp. RTI2.1]MEB0115373.1 response regulator [Undibacterium sp. RTI2.2]MEB0230581.1 response regulator [Undibacterium sp. 10I3]MEB0257099.1 response regulator [Undibacterium sp. 5I1]
MPDKAKRYKDVTIMLVDDDDVDVMGVERALKKLKIINPVVRARDGIEALELLRMPNAVRQPYLIMLDLNMPRMNGLEMLEVLRNDPSLSSAVVFVLTTSKTDEDKVAAYQKHVAGYIVKSQVGDGFLRVMEMIDHFWRVVELPVME